MKRYAHPRSPTLPAHVMHSDVLQRLQTLLRVHETVLAEERPEHASLTCSGCIVDGRAPLSLVHLEHVGSAIQQEVDAGDMPASRDAQHK